MQYEEASWKKYFPNDNTIKFSHTIVAPFIRATCMKIRHAFVNERCKTQRTEVPTRVKSVTYKKVEQEYKKRRTKHTISRLAHVPLVPCRAVSTPERGGFARPARVVSCAAVWRRRRASACSDASASFERRNRQVVVGVPETTTTGRRRRPSRYWHKRTTTETLFRRPPRISSNSFLKRREEASFSSSSSPPRSLIIILLSFVARRFPFRWLTDEALRARRIDISTRFRDKRDTVSRYSGFPWCSVHPRRRRSIGGAR